MSNKNQIGFSLVFWETLKEYDEKTKTYKPIKNKRVEVCHELSDLISDNEEVKNMLIDKMFEYKDDIKQMLNRGEYCDIPSYHKESLEKDQRIADLEAKLAEKEHSIEMLNQHLTDKALEIEKADRMFKDCEADRKFEQEKKNIALKRVSELTEQLAKKEKLLKKYVATSCPIIQDKIELLEKVKSYFCEECEDGDGVKTGDWTITKDACEVAEYLDTLISEIKGE